MNSHRSNRYGVGIIFLIASVLQVNSLWAHPYVSASAKTALSIPGPGDSTSGSDTPKLKYPIKDKKDWDKGGYHNSLDLKSPIEEEVRYDAKTGMYKVYRKMGNQWVATGRQMTFDQYLKERSKEDNKGYFQQKSKVQGYGGGTGLNSAQPKLHLTPKALSSIFGNGPIEIQPSGSFEILLGGNFNVVRNPALSRRNQRNGNIDFQPKMQLNVRGSIGEKVNLGLNFDTEATFDFENQTKLGWQGKEDDILKAVELGNVSLPLNSNLIQAGQSLFGVKTKMQFGKTSFTSIFTQQKGQTTETEVTGGAQVTEYKILADNYDANRHFFLGQYFLNSFDKSLERIPVIMSSVIINRIEVWVTNRSGNVDNNRDVVAFMDLGENNPYNGALGTSPSALPGNDANSLYASIKDDADARLSGKVGDRLATLWPQLQQGFDYEILNNARQLSETEFTVNKRLGYISLNSALNADEILAVAFEFTYNGQVYKVGEFGYEHNPNSNGKQNVVFLKMLKGPTIRTRLPMWNLMMKNIYTLPTYNLNLADFRLNIMYADDPTGADLFYLPVEGFPQLSNRNPLLRVLNLDKLNLQMEAKPDGVFDAVEGVTVESQFARIIFPVVQPFGDHLRKKFDGNTEKANYYVFDALYDSTKWLAQQDALHNKFYLVGSYKGSSSNEIQLGGFNLKPGSVKVFANGRQLSENSDYIVDYSLGRVTITNQGIINSGAVIKVSTENQSLFNVQQKTLVGTRIDHKLNRNTMLGGTLMHLYERALTPKTNIGDEPLLNTIFGFDGSYNNTSRFLTKLIDRLPFIETKEVSRVNFYGEYARIIPHAARSLQRGVRGVSYLDDFENAETQYDIKNFINWSVASVPQKQPDIFPETQQTDRMRWNDYIGSFAFYTIDPVFFRSTDPKMPKHIKDDPNMSSNHYMREIDVRQVFPQKQLQQGVPNILPTLDLALFPKLKGQYNFNTDPADLNADGTFKDPRKSWAGIMRRIETTDFEAANIDYLELWMMDPFYYESPTTATPNQGTLYLQLGNISEDILPDRRKAFENGFAKDCSAAGMDTTAFGRVPKAPTVLNAFDTDLDSRPCQDIGLDGLNDDQERNFYEAEYLSKLRTNFGPTAPITQQAEADPSNDNFVYYLDGAWDANKTNILRRYQRYNRMQDNSNLSKKLSDGTPMSGKANPDDEDINRDFTMNQSEDYFQYNLKLSKKDLVVGKGYVTDSVAQEVTLRNGKKERVTWYQFKVPVRQYTKIVGNIGDFKSIRFIRMVLKGFSDSVICRFGVMQLVRADWRRFLLPLSKPGVIIPNDPNDNTKFSISTVNIEENSRREPVKYVTPPGIVRETDQTQPGAVQMNEQSLSLSFCNLKPSDARGAFKTSQIDIRNYKTLKMFVHAEGQDIRDGEIRAFIRLGTDLTNNYYQYEIPLQITRKGATAPSEIWPGANEINFDLETLYDIKLNRQSQGWPLTVPFTQVVNGANVTVVGLPDLSNVRAIMLGVKNVTDIPKCGEIWFNELRLQDFVNKGGWAALARLNMQLADFGTINASGNIRTIGFGGIDKKLNERSLTFNRSYDVSANFELGKFFSQKTGVSIPFFIGQTETWISPKYNPLNPDILFERAIKNAPDDAEKTRIRKAGEDYTRRRSMNFTNVRKNKTGGKVHPWDISNFNGTYSYQDEYHRDAQIEEAIKKIWRASVAYNYSKQSPSLKPFNKVIKAKGLSFIRDFNLNLLPSTVNVRYDVDRLYMESQQRNNDKFNFMTTPRLYNKNFTMSRNYSAVWPITNSISLNYSAIANARIQEPYGSLDTPGRRESVRKEFYSLGRMTAFQQQVQANYTLPFQKIGLLNWISSAVNYNANFGWAQAPPAFQTLGNTIQNGRELSGNLQFNFNSFYNKFKKNNKKAVADKSAPKSKPAKQNPVGKFITMLKNVSLNYSNKEGTVLPGFKYTPDYFGQNFAHSAPGIPFVLGQQNSELRYRLARQGALNNDTAQFNFFAQNYSRTLNGNATLEPFPGFRIQLDMDKNWGRNSQSVFRYDEVTKNFRDFGFQQTGTYSMTYVFWKTAFAKDQTQQGNKNISPIFQEFQNSRYTIAQRLQNADERVTNKGAIDPRTGFPLGYGPNQQDVLIGSFWAAYTGKNAGSSQTGLFPKIPLPSWSINFTGLSRIKQVKKIFNNITFQHSYKGRYQVGGFTSNLNYQQGAVLAGTTDLVARYQVTNVTISEQFQPLLGVNFSTTNNWTGGFTWNKSRNVMLMPANYGLNEARTQEVVIRGGFRTDDLRLPFKYKGSRIRLRNDFRFDLNISISNNTTVNRRLDNNTDQPTAGARVVYINPTLDYMINNKINLNMFYSRRTSKPATGLVFPTALTEFGIKLRYTLQ